MLRSQRGRAGVGPGCPLQLPPGGQPPPLTWVPPLLRPWAEARGACPCVWSTRAPQVPQESPGTWGGPGRPFPAHWLVGGLWPAPVPASSGSPDGAPGQGRVPCSLRAALPAVSTVDSSVPVPGGGQPRGGHPAPTGGAHRRADVPYGDTLTCAHVSLWEYTHSHTSPYGYPHTHVS